MVLGGQPPVPLIGMGAEAKTGKRKGDLEIKVKDGGGSRAGMQEVPEDARVPLSAENFGSPNCASEGGSSSS